MARRSRSTNSAISSASDSQSADSQSAPDSHTRDESEGISEVRLLGSLRPLADREERIAIAAYWRAAQRQFEPGHELDDWLAAEREINAQEAGSAQQTPPR